MVHTAYEVRDRIKSETGYEPCLINVRFINPLDVERVKETIESFDYIAVMEETVRRGSIGEAVAYEMSTSENRCGSRLLHYCVKSEVLQHGSVKRLKEEQGLDADTIYEDIISHISKKLF